MAMSSTGCCTVFCCSSSSRCLSSSSQVCSGLPSMLGMSTSISVSFRHGGSGGGGESPLLHQRYNVGCSRQISRRFQELRAMGTENKESKAEETRPARAAAPEEESGKAATLVEGSRSSKLGFGADARTDEGKGSKEKKQQQKRKQQSATVRRAAPQQPLLSAPGNPQTQQIETAYALSLGFLGILIFVEGIILAASGFLPEEWDGFLVTNLYPSFTPTVGVFLAAALAYGLFKTQGGEPKK
ncbi:unnamed protein product [Sphagnum jensenii]|uniref:Uncharacterized protein n=1 Tax=Sphagnum jensenii TaxID=128206 RepID=A0ABP0W6Y1_9BRYO